MGEFNSDDHYIYYCGQESIRRNGVSIIVKKESKVQYLDAVSKTTELYLFISKANHSISQSSKSMPQPVMLKAEVEWFYEDLQALPEITPKKRRPFHYRGLECKSRKSRNTWSNRQIWPWSTE